MDHSREVLKSHSEIYKVYGFLVQCETQYLGPCCSNVEQQEITIKRIRRSNCVTYWIQIYPGESVSPGGVSQLFEHTAPKSLSSEDLPWATRIGEYNIRPSLYHRESLQPSLSFGLSYNPTQRSWDRKVCLRARLGNLKRLWQHGANSRDELLCPHEPRGLGMLEEIRCSFL